MKKSMMLVLVLFLSIGFAGLASAHVTVQPKEVPAGSYQVFTVRVPSEKEAATTSVKLAIPDGVAVSRIEPKPDWTYEIEKGAEDKFVSVTWKATGKGLGATEFGEFRVQGKVADDAKELVWKAYQTYSDGEVVEWTGAADADKPASVTAVTAAAGEGDGHGAAPSGASGEAEDKDGRDTLTLSLAVAGLIAGVLALLIALFRKRT
ncbi:YcnI family copper-binding membrane protein [Cohnella silvisoli]|uniref:YcnI family protein n=1 Tax=Cohnella silvisoli TaxID=2873699 RepID=A0ABV1KXG4_9BACL|nr:YcnI family protein [Cohnella silvisoli]MCD9024197.1 YcnI family protein [Cohnella silvisoli]